MKMQHDRELASRDHVSPARSNADDEHAYDRESAEEGPLFVIGEQSADAILAGHRWCFDAPATTAGARAVGKFAGKCRRGPWPGPARTAKSRHYPFLVLLPLSGPRLRVRAWRADEAADVMGLLGSADTMGDMGAGGRLLVHSDEQATQWLERRLHQQEGGGLTMWAVDSEAGDVLVGACGLFPEEYGLELAYVISHRHRGRRYATEAAGLVLAGLDADAVASTVFATIAPDNFASRRVAESLGLRCTNERIDERGTLVYRR